MTENERLAKNLTDWWGTPGGPGVFAINAPCKLTEYAAGRFHKKSYIGEEQLRPFEAYVGKKGDVIIKFREVDGDAAHRHIEMTVNEAITHLDWFKDYYVDLCNTLDDKRMAEHREIAAAKEEAADAAARHAANPLFGSW